MNNALIISYNFFRKILSLAEYLEHSSQSLITLIDNIEKDKVYGKEYMRGLNEELFSLYTRACKIKEELVYAAVHQEEILNSNERFANRFKELSDDFKKIHAICQKISEPNYFINTEGKLTK